MFHLISFFSILYENNSRYPVVCNIPVSFGNSYILGIGWLDGIKRITPSSNACFLVAFLLLAAGIFVLVRSHLLPVNLPLWLLHSGTWVLFVIFMAMAVGEFKYVGFFKKIKSSQFAIPDTKYYSPLCVLIAALLYCLEFLN
jgi:hypothetical protein